MWYRNRIWNQYLKNIGATDRMSARFLERYLQRIGITKDYASVLEIFDLQQYKVIKKSAKVKDALREKIKMPFIFVACKN